MTQLAGAVDSASLWLWTGGWRTWPWKPWLKEHARQAGFAALRGLLWLLMLPPFLLAAAARLTARAYVRTIWATGWAISWTVAAFAAGWTAAGGREDHTWA